MNADRKIFIFPVQLTTSKVGNVTGLIHTLAICRTHTYTIHVDDIFAVGERERCDQVGRDMNEMVPVKNLGELRWYSRCLYE